MKSRTQKTWRADPLDARAFAEAGGRLEGAEPLQRFSRLADERLPVNEAMEPVWVRWTAAGELRAAPGGGSSDAWLHLAAETRVSVTCQRCLAPVEVPLQVDRWFRFVADEAAALAQDNDCEEDLLALDPSPHLMDVLEDELLMALPLVPMHDVCPAALPMSAGPHDRAAGKMGIGAGADAGDAVPHPFAVLAKLKKV